MSCVRVGEPAPKFTLRTVRAGDTQETMGKKVTLEDYRGKWLVLFFYPLDFTSVCPTELIALSERYEELEELGTEVLGVSVDSVYSHLAWLSTPRGQGGVGPLRYPLASDITKEVARDYGVLLKNEGIALRGLFIIDPSGVLQLMTINNLNIGRNTDEVLRSLLALQTGGLCPSDWRPGQALLNTL